MKDLSLNSKIVPTGKAGPELLQKLLEIPRKNDPNLIIGPTPGEDAAVVKLDKPLLVVTSDPITFPTLKPGYYAVHVNANDVAVMGAAPRFFIMTVILPPGSSETEAENIMLSAVSASDSLGITLIGGHTEVSEAVNTPVVSITMLGELIKDNPVKTGGGRTGDKIVQVNPMGVEGTSILASEHTQVLEQEFGAALVKKALDFLYNPGISVVDPARLAMLNLEVHAMHDPTEGGLATGLLEMASASNTGLMIDQTELLIAPETRRICAYLGHDPMGLISSGCLLMAVPEGQAEPALELMRNSGYQAAVIGGFTDVPGQYLTKNSTGQTKPLPTFLVDELVK